jgi:hypothetical protein
MTGFTNVEASMGNKWVELLKEDAVSFISAALRFSKSTSDYSATYPRVRQRMTKRASWVHA